jgi:hypothetical protein
MQRVEMSPVVPVPVTQKEVARLDHGRCDVLAFSSSESYVQHGVESGNLKDECVQLVIKCS